MRTRPDKISRLAVGDKIVERDGHGYLIDPDKWDEDVAKAIADEEGLVLGEEHMLVIRFMRSYYDEHDIPADARFVFAFLAEALNQNKTAARRHFFELFPYGYVKQACKIAGMRQPRAWSTG